MSKPHQPKTSGFNWNENPPASQKIKRKTSNEMLYAVEFKTPEKYQHCQNQNCNQMNFLPINCTACNKKFCHECYKYEDHGCTKNVDSFQIPSCFACGKNVPFLDSSRNAEKSIDFHIRFHCEKTEKMREKIFESPELGFAASMSKNSASSNTQAANYQLPKPKIYKNKCSKKFCKKKSAHNFKCVDCKKSFCVAHRHESDHDCVGKLNTLRKHQLNHLNLIQNVALMGIC